MSKNGGACRACLRRRWLIGELSAMLDFRRAPPARLLDTLDLDDLELIAALGGSRREQLLARWRSHEPSGSRGAPLDVCSHDPRYPPLLRALRHAPTLQVGGGGALLERTLGHPGVALAGAGECTAHGARIASMLARSLSRAGVVVVASTAHELGRAALASCDAAEGLCLAVLDHGLGARHGLSRTRCELSPFAAELPARAWTALATQRLAAGLAEVTVIVEARTLERDLLAARVALSLGRPLGATPGLITNPLARGPHELIADGAQLIADAGSVLELLPCGERRLDRRAPAAPPVRPDLSHVLDEIRSGASTIEGLTPRAGSCAAVLGALGELEALGMIERVKGGRYVARG